MARVRCQHGEQVGHRRLPALQCFQCCGALHARGACQLRSCRVVPRVWPCRQSAQLWNASGHAVAHSPQRDQGAGVLAQENRSAALANAEERWVSQDFACVQRSCQRQDCSAVCNGTLQHALHGAAGTPPQQQRCSLQSLGPARMMQATLAAAAACMRLQHHRVSGSFT